MKCLKINILRSENVVEIRKPLLLPKFRARPENGRGIPAWQNHEFSTDYS